MAYVKETRVYIRVSDKQKAAIEARAQQKGMTVSEYIRYLTLLDIEKNS